MLEVESCHRLDVNVAPAAIDMGSWLNTTQCCTLMLHLLPEIWAPGLILHNAVR